jgi:hypothetical protein
MHKSQRLLILLTMEIWHYYVYHNNTIIQGESKKTDTFVIHLNIKCIRFFWLTLYILREWLHPLSFEYFIALQGVPKKSDTIEMISLFLSRS